MQRSFVSVLFASVIAVSASACGDGGGGSIFEPKPECEGAAIVPLMGEQPQVISFLEIGEVEDGFDLDGDGDPDNKLAAVGSLARSAIDDAFDDFSILIPIEFFDYSSATTDECVKFAIYLGDYALDRDGDQKETARGDGDCNDHDPNIHEDAPEVPDNGIDDNCNGLADETIVVEETDAGTNMTIVPSDNTDDGDGDGVTIADGDCDDTNDMVAPGMDEICSDGYDNDCDGEADMSAMCNPYDDSPDEIQLDPLAFESDGTPLIAFTSGTVTDVDGALMLEAGPSLFSVNIPVTDDLNLDLRISGATIVGEVQQHAPSGGIQIVGGRLGGVIDANTADKVRGLDVEEIGLSPEDSLLDATFANILGPILALPSLDVSDNDPFAGCRTPDIDVDRDGLEAFCDSDPLDERQTVDTCIDGNGKIYTDEVDAQGNVTKQCTEFTDKDGNLLFVDGISVEINFDTVPVLLPAELPPLQ